MDVRVEGARAYAEGESLVMSLSVRFTAPGGAYAKLYKAASEAEAARFTEFARGHLAEPIATLNKLRSELAAADAQIPELQRRLDGLQPGYSSERVLVDCEKASVERRRKDLFEQLKGTYANACRMLNNIMAGKPAATSLTTFTGGQNPMARPAFARPDVSAAAWREFATAAEDALNKLAVVEVTKNVEKRPDAVQGELLKLLGGDPEQPGGLRSFIAAAAELVGAA